jgi:Ni,Fe-hydrogenase III component G
VELPQKKPEGLVLDLTQQGVEQRWVWVSKEQVEQVRDLMVQEEEQKLVLLVLKEQEERVLG